MAVSAQERSFLLKNSIFKKKWGHLEYKYKKVTWFPSCTKFTLQSFFTFVKKKKLLNKNLSKGMILQKC